MSFLSKAAIITTSSGTAGESHLRSKGGQRVCSPCQRQHPDRPEQPAPWKLSSPTLLEAPPAAVLVAPLCPSSAPWALAPNAHRAKLGPGHGGACLRSHGLPGHEGPLPGASAVLGDQDHRPLEKWPGRQALPANEA